MFVFTIVIHFVNHLRTGLPKQRNVDNAAKRKPDELGPTISSGRNTNSSGRITKQIFADAISKYWVSLWAR